MDKLAKLLADAVESTTFRVTRREYDGNGSEKQVKRREVTGADLARDQGESADSAAHVEVAVDTPAAAAVPLEAELRSRFSNCIEPDTGLIGHGFRIDGGGERLVRSFVSAPWLGHVEVASPFDAFVQAAVRAAAILGHDEAARLLHGWARGAPLELRTTTVVSGLKVDERVSLECGAELTPLPLSTDELPRLPTTLGVRPADVLGLSLLSLPTLASPAVFAPPASGDEAIVQSKMPDGVDFGVLCDALSLDCDTWCAPGPCWSEAADTSALSERTLASWGPHGDRILPRGGVGRTFHPPTGDATLQVRQGDASLRRPDAKEVDRLVEALRGSDDWLGIPMGRWKSSKHPNARLEDRYIDLRIALETLYLRDLGDKYRGELRFRLALTGAWHLGTGAAERERIRKALLDAYDAASGVVHAGVVPRKTPGSTLSEGQALCRRGLLKLLEEGGPPNWSALLVGAPSS